MRSSQLTGLALEETLTTYQQFWNQVEAMEQETRAAAAQDRPVEIRYDPAVVQAFIAHLPDTLQARIADWVGSFYRRSCSTSG